MMGQQIPNLPPVGMLGVYTFRDSKTKDIIHGHALQVMGTISALDQVSLARRTCLSGLNSILSCNPGLWQNSISMLGDSPPHMDCSEDVKYPEICKAAALKDIVINAIRCGSDPETESVWQNIAAKSEGQYMSIAQSGGVTVVSTPYDAKLVELSAKLMRTGVYAGERIDRESALKIETEAADEADMAAAMKDAKKLAVDAAKGEFRGKATRAGAGRGAAVGGALGGMGFGSGVGNADLLGRYARDGAEALDKMKDEQLPEEMKKMSADERKKYLEKKVSERKEIEKQIEDIGKQRAQYIAEEIKKHGSGDKSFDSVVLDMLKKQGIKKGISFGDDQPAKQEKK
jgi:hypothetical protein